MTSSTEPVRVRGLDHVTIVVTDLDRSARFYTEVLGMDLVERPAFGFPGRWLQADDAQVHLNLAGPEAGPAGLAGPGGTSLSRGFHYAFRVVDCDAAAAHLAALGHAIIDGPRSRPDGARQLYLRDPDGHLVELFSRGG